MLKAVDLIQVQTTAIDAQGHRVWVPALPLAPGFATRLRDAWEVFRGRAQAVKQE